MTKEEYNEIFRKTEGKLFDNKNPDSKFAYTDIVIKNRFNI